MNHAPHLKVCADRIEALRLSLLFDEASDINPTQVAQHHFCLATAFLETAQHHMALAHYAEKEAK